MTKKRPPNKSWLLPYMLIVTGSCLLFLWGTHRYFYNRSLSLSDALLTSYSLESNKFALPIHITVGDKISLPVVEAGKINNAWTVSPTSANHVHGSALPGQKGNMIIYGHNLNTIFGYLVDSKVGDEVKIRMTNGALYQYKITETQIVSQSQTRLLSPTTEEVLTLYTCTGFFDSLRFVARAVPVESH